MTDSNATELKGCPFCGKKQAIHKEFGSWILNTTSHDRKCIMRKLLAFGMSGGLVFNTEAEAIAAWNTRTPEQAVAATLGAPTLTAEQVMSIAGKHQPDYCSDTHVCFDWQAIADELNEWLRGKAVKR